MAGTIGSIQMTASATIEPMRIVCVSGDGTVVQSTANLVNPIGVSGRGAAAYNATPHATSGMSVEIRTTGEVAKLVAGEAITAGDRIVSDATGRGIVADTNSIPQNVIGIANNTVAGAGGIIDLVVNPHVAPGSGELAVTTGASPLAVDTTASAIAITTGGTAGTESFTIGTGSGVTPGKKIFIRLATRTNGSDVVAMDHANILAEDGVALQAVQLDAANEYIELEFVGASKWRVTRANATVTDA